MFVRRKFIEPSASPAKGRLTSIKFIVINSKGSISPGSCFSFMPVFLSFQTGRPDVKLYGIRKRNKSNRSAGNDSVNGVWHLASGLFNLFDQRSRLAKVQLHEIDLFIYDFGIRSHVHFLDGR